MEDDTSSDTQSQSFNESDIPSSRNESILSVNEALKSSVDGYVNLFNVDTSKQFTDLEELVDGLLAKLEEYCSIVESIRYESKDALFTTIPVLHERCEQLQPLFKKIDHIENFISIVSNSVSDAEAKVSKAEKELGSKSLKKILKSVPVPKFLSGKKEIQPYLKQDTRPYDYVPPSSFKTSDYFTKDNTLNNQLE